MQKLETFLNEKDFEQISEKNISAENILQQLKNFENGFPAVNITKPATIENGGIKKLSDDEIVFFSSLYKEQKLNKKIVKFVPASGAATRMFKKLFEFVNSDKTEPDEKISNLLKNLEKLAFFDDLNAILKKQNSSVENELKNKNFKKIINLILNENGLNYGNLPKGLIKFHKYEDHSRTAFEEHISESALYATTEKGNFLHFTVSPEHKEKFENLSHILINKYNKKTNSDFTIKFSIQSPATDTIAVTPENKPFRLENGRLLFRPGGHGALIHNLNAISADLIFIKNIDNIVPDKLKQKNCVYKRVLAGILISTQNKIFSFLKTLKNTPDNEQLSRIFEFTKTELNVHSETKFENLEKNEKIKFLTEILDRPLRVCGMVKNEGEPGGGPFFVEKNNIETLQIVEKAQIDLTNPDYKAIFESSTHFNPVDIVVSPVRYDGTKFDLTNFIDKETGFISEKSQNGRPLKALELPGLWNGAMAFWNTIFVEVPLQTFNPVKEIFDLLKPNHLNT